MSLVFIVAAFAVVAINAFFVAAEYAIIRVRATRIEELVASGVRRAAAARDVLRRLDDSISACQLGITIASLALGGIGEPAFAHLFEPAFAFLGARSAAAAHTLSIAVSFLIITFLHVVLGELVPKTLAITHAEKTALAVAWPLRMFRFVFYPLIVFMKGSAGVAIRAFGLKPPSEASLAHSEAELRMILAVSRRSGALSESHGRLLSAALDFPDRAVRQLMVPRADILYLDANKPYDESRTAGVLDPRTLSIALDDLLPAERTVVVDSGAFMGWPSMYLRVPDAAGFVFPQAFQCVGLALGNAIGAAIARPDRLTVAALGDGGALMSLPELETLGRLGLPLLVVIYDDAAYGAEVHHFAPMGEAVDLAGSRA